MNSNQYCIIMAGGHLNRFWPISREDMPGHFLDISGSGKSLVRMAYDRCTGVVPQENIIVVTLSRFKRIGINILRIILLFKLLSELRVIRLKIK